MGLKWAIDQGIAYRQVIFLSDECLILTQPLDTFFLEQTQKDNIGMIGIRSRKNDEDAWRDAQPQLFEWRLPVESWERPPVSVVDDVMILAGRFIGPLYEKGLLVPEGCEKWPGTFGSYMCWLCHMLGFYVVSWGYEDKPLPPLYFNRCQGQYLTPPHLLKTQFLVFGPANGVMGYSERDLRELYKQQRGERAAEVQKHQPVVTGPEQSDVLIQQQGQ